MFGIDFDIVSSRSLYTFIAIVVLLIVLSFFMTDIGDSIPVAVYFVFIMAFFLAYNPDEEDYMKFGGYIAIAGLITWFIWIYNWWKTRDNKKSNLFTQFMPADDIAFLIIGSVMFYVIMRMYAYAVGYPHPDVWAGVLAVAFSTWFFFWRIAMYMPFLQTTQQGELIRSAIAYRPNFNAPAPPTST